MYCPQCGTSYRDGFTECSDCHIRLVKGEAPDDRRVEFDPNLDLVVVLETNDPIQLALAKGVLEEAEIPFYVLGRIATLITDVDGFLHKWVKLQVPRNRETEARELLEEVLQPVGGDPEPGSY